ncbi:BBE domain-containing protein [Pseudarthrobacter sp. P1]|uniref:BBE domain-containing protein n=1 Tax=Pseudarthrobacter sp. P1 TaxID=3418418 RepID=UPI003CE8C92C
MIADGGGGRSGQRSDPCQVSLWRPKYERLTGIKTEWDPENMFRYNANIRPGTVGADHDGGLLPDNAWNSSLRVRKRGMASPLGRLPDRRLCPPP